MAQSGDQRQSRFRIFLFLFSLTCGFSLALSTNVLRTVLGGAQHLQTVYEWKSLSREVSGLVRWAEEGKLHLAWVGDHEAVIHEAVLYGDQLVVEGSMDFSGSLLARFSPCGNQKNPGCGKFSKLLTRQWEGIFRSPRGEYYVLHEMTGVIYIIAPGAQGQGEMQGSIHIEVPQGVRVDPHHFAEGLFFAESGDLWLVQENPPHLHLYGRHPHKVGLPTHGQHFYRRMRSYKLPHTLAHCDLSEVAGIDSDALFLLSQKCGWIGKVSMQQLLQEHVHRLDIVQKWLLPGHMRTAEGLAVLEEGVFIVGLDFKHASKSNLMLLKSPMNGFTLSESPKVKELSQR
ncbi:MAG: hypothetical protein OXT67_10035 [Zetaproteobacteria bacterium]|nr:hypothetical protein [Zetaproteobacteria bacterium]